MGLVLKWSPLLVALSSPALSEGNGWKRIDYFHAPTPKAAVLAYFLRDNEQERRKFGGVICLASKKAEPLSETEIAFTAKLSAPVPVSTQCSIKNGNVIEPRLKGPTVLLYASVKSKISERQFIVSGASYVGPLNAFESSYRVTRHGERWMVEESFSRSIS